MTNATNTHIGKMKSRLSDAYLRWPADRIEMEIGCRGIRGDAREQRQPDDGAVEIGRRGIRWRREGTTVTRWRPDG